MNKKQIGSAIAIFLILIMLCNISANAENIKTKNIGSDLDVSEENTINKCFYGKAKLEDGSIPFFFQTQIKVASSVYNPCGIGINGHFYGFTPGFKLEKGQTYDFYVTQYKILEFQIYRAKITVTVDDNYLQNVGEAVLKAQID